MTNNSERKKYIYVLSTRQTRPTIAQIRLVNGPEPGHRTGMNRYRTGPESVDRNFDRYRDEPDRNYRDGSSVPSRSTIYRDGTGMNRNGPGWNGTGLTGRYFLKLRKYNFFYFLSIN